MCCRQARPVKIAEKVRRVEAREFQDTSDWAVFNPFEYLHASECLRGTSTTLVCSGSSLIMRQAFSCIEKTVQRTLMVGNRRRLDEEDNCALGMMSANLDGQRAPVADMGLPDLLLVDPFFRNCH